MSTDAATAICSVCGESAALPATAECNWCDQRYHLNQRSDIEGKDCGSVWIDEQYLALQFACNTCLADSDRAIVGLPVTPATRPAATVRASTEPRQRRYRRRE